MTHGVLHAAHSCSSPGAGGCLPRKGGFGKALWALLATCSADPMIQGDKQGPMLFVAPRRGPFMRALGDLIGPLRVPRSGAKMDLSACK